MKLRNGSTHAWTAALIVALASGGLWTAAPAAAQSVGEPALTEPGVVEPGAAQPQTVQPQPVQPQPVQPESAAPPATVPETATPETATPETATPGTALPEAASPAPAVDPAPAEPVAAESAAAESGITGPEPAQHEGGGMPQLDSSTFPPQLIWLAITFIALYLLMSRLALPRIGAVLDERRERISDDLDKASQLRQEADGVLAEYEQGLASARTEAQSIIRTVGEEISAAAATAQEELGRELAEQTRDAEVRIAAAKEAALANVRSIATEVAQAATVKLIGEDIASTDVEGAVKSAMGQRG